MLPPIPVRLPMSFLFPRAKPRVSAIPERLDLAGGPVAVTVRRNPRAKRMILRLAPGASGVVVTAPRQVSGRAIAEFLERHRGWVEERVARAPGHVVVADGATIPFRGGTLRLVSAPERRASRFETVDGEACLMVGGAPEHFVRRVVDTLKREARQDLQAAVDRHAATVGLRPRSMALKDTRSRWGSCTIDRRLAFSWRIVMAPPEVLDYLAAHEVAHFREMNHGASFWALCRELCPGMDHGRDWLKRHGAGLHAIDCSGA
ncbi:putative metal-dependent hydrolase [Aurantimonas manganoxydans SI85-9A1]|uniref:Putative metal-dependent hydrolase n=2 Tax=Aurantimonas manganoxydans TaxID=651183 RepID=Q1YF99_AURMS|nr:SprT family zinc-dependent metalloprotease [Aurantimonas manganoxydans]EAS49074.1 putative metal-dependent hydrolase [Aurantimonas manganoxydans SI85-9A1]